MKQVRRERGKTEREKEAAFDEEEKGDRCFNFF
jgi:hypothetical protein